MANIAPSEGLPQAYQLSAHLIYRNTTDRVPVTLIFPAGWLPQAPVTCHIGKAASSVTITAISPPEGRARRILTLDSGHKIFVDASHMPAFLNQAKWSVAIDRAERAPLSLLIIISLAVTLCGGALTYLFLPKIGDMLADHIPEPIIEQLSQATLFQLDNFALSASELPQDKQDSLIAHHKKLLVQADLPDDIALLFRSSELMGPNALALPGGPVIILDELVEIAPSDDAIVGVIAHEIAHIALQHNRKHLARDSLFAIMQMMVSGTQDLVQTTNVMKNLVFSGYSRQFEEEADYLARQWLQKAGYDVTQFDAMLIALHTHDCKDPCPENDNNTASGWFDTHPSLSERLSVQPQ
ncbi:MAG: M48 family metallopeptidase [Candidatus Puniceispirillaceae bacterium]